MVASTTDLWQLATGSELLQQPHNPPTPIPQKGLSTLKKCCLLRISDRDKA